MVNAVPFTKKGEEKFCISKIEIMGQQLFLHAYEKKMIGRLISDLTKSINKGINIVITNNDYEKNQFNEILTSPNQTAAILKMENEGKALMVMTIKELEKMIKEMKS
ncbi:MAG: hypothetical protein PHU63_03110 [Candidatus ainarchaeum sp.]|nr:hypothetical protein [Candidatus ainarchaeum sp.]